MLETELTRVFHTLFLASSSRLYWPYLLIYAGAGVMLVRIASGGTSSWLSALAGVFPRRVYGHRSFRLDVSLLGVQLVLARIGAFSLVSYAVTRLSQELIDVLRTSLPVLANHVGSETIDWVDRLVFTLISIAAFDLGYFLVHLAMHRVPALWAFHKVHHSAEHLNPLTAWRLHPVDYFLNLVAGTSFATLAIGLFSLWHGVDVQALTVLNLSIVYFVFLLTANLRHSHLWIGFGPWLSRLFVSPAMHQIHHGMDRHHLNRNYGVIFSLWDAVVGSRYIPHERETVRPGLRGRSGLSSSDSVWTHLLRPFVDVWRMVRRGRRTSPWSRRRACLRTGDPGATIGGAGVRPEPRTLRQRMDHDADDLGV